MKYQNCHWKCKYARYTILLWWSWIVILFQESCGRIEGCSQSGRVCCTGLHQWVIYWISVFALRSWGFTKAALRHTCAKKNIHQHLYLYSIISRCRWEGGRGCCSVVSSQGNVAITTINTNPANPRIICKRFDFVQFLKYFWKMPTSEKTKQFHQLSFST